MIHDIPNNSQPQSNMVVFLFVIFWVFWRAQACWVWLDLWKGQQQQLQVNHPEWIFWTYFYINPYPESAGLFSLLLISGRDSLTIHYLFWGFSPKPGGWERSLLTGYPDSHQKMADFFLGEWELSKVLPSSGRHCWKEVSGGPGP